MSKLFENNNIFLVLTYRCNAFCKKCMTRYYFKRNQEMPLDLMNFILDMMKSADYEGCVSVGSGEPLLYSNLDKLICGVLDINQDSTMRILSNGMLFRDDLPIAFFNRRCKWGITFDGFSKGTLTDMQYGVDTEVVKNNVTAVVKKYGPDCLYLNYTLHQKNYQELPDFCAFAANLGVKEVYSTELLVFEGYEKRLSSYAIQKTPEVHEAYQRAWEVLSAKGISTKGVIECDGSNKFACFKKNMASPIIDVDGAVTFCNGHEDVELGNIRDADIVERWEAFYDGLCNNPLGWCSKCHSKKLSNGLYGLPKTVDSSLITG